MNPKQEIAPGALIARRFQVERQAGSGGMGTVYCARDLESQARVALKCVRPDGGDYERFAREAAVLAEMDHPGVVRYVAHGTTDAGVPWLAMEWLEGEDLATRLTSGALPVPDAVSVVSQIGEALGALHARGLVHRDIKPSNVFLVETRADRAKLLDFGIARPTLGTHLTGTGLALGTPAYMAPEQARAESGLDARVDVFALGCVLFECLVGRPPFVGDHGVAVLAKILVEEAPSVREHNALVPRALDDLVARMLSKDRAKRPPNGAAVRGELASMALGDDSASKPRPFALAPAITRAEQRVFSVVLTRAASGLERTLLPQQRKSQEGEVRAAVNRHGGRLEILANGSMLVTIAARQETLGTEEVAAAAVPSDDATQAAACALALGAIVGDSNVVLATGRGVVAGRLPVGQVIDRAAMLLARPPSPRGVRTDFASAGLLDRRYRIEGVEGNEGNADDLRLLGARAADDGVRTLLGRATRCVGRERELATLELSIRQCIDDSAASVVLVTAPAGTGKTRLVHEVLQAARTRGEAHVLVARADVISAGSPFGMTARLLRQWAGFLDGERGEGRRARLVALLTASFSFERATEMADLLGEMAGAPDGEEGERMRVLKRDPALLGDAVRMAFEDWVRARAAETPLIIVLEDLHWGDLSSIKLIDAALRNLADRPLLVLATARPEVHERFPGLFAERGLQEIRLGVVSRRACERFVRELLGPTVPEAVVSLVVERAGGHPFYLEELVRAVAEGATPTALPDTVLGMIQARLDGLGPEAKRVLRAASIFGETFWSGGVASLLGSAFDRSGVQAVLDALAAREIVERRPKSSISGETELVFRHALVRDAAYAMLTDDDRRVGHGMAGDWLERGGSRDALVLAEHFERGSEPRRALQWYRRGAEQALEGNDLASVITLAERALRCDPDAPSRGALDLLLAEAHYYLGDLPLATELAVRAVEELEGDDERWFGAVSTVITAAGQRGDNDGVAAWLARVCARPPLADRRAELICLCRGVSQLQFAALHHQLDDARARMKEIVATSAALGPLAEGWVARLEAEDLLDQRRLDRAVVAYFRAGDLFHQAGAIRHALLMEILGHAFAALYASPESGPNLERLLTESQRLGLSYLVGFTRAELTGLHAFCGRWTETVAMGRAAEASIRGSARLEFWVRRFIAAASLQLGDYETVKQETALMLTLNVRDALHGGAHGLMARALLRQGRTDDALAHARRGVVLADPEFSDLLDGEPELALAETLHALGDRDGARAALQRALDIIQNCANLIEDPVARDGYVRGTMFFRDVLTLAEQWGLRPRDA